MQTAPVLIIGAGLAGLVAAIALSPRPCLIIAPDKPGTASSSAWAQGGIAAAVGAGDSPSDHGADTLAAGCGIGNSHAIAELTKAGPGAIEWLADKGVPFDRDSGGAFVLSREAAHGRARVVRIGGDQAGREMTRALAAYARSLGSITLRTGLRAGQLLKDGQGRVVGVRAFNESGRDHEFLAPVTVLATGGLGGLFEVTTNPVSACGLGAGMALEAGARLTDLEFIQFHPTALNVGSDPAPLISEAVRGEGAILVDRDGQILCDPLAARDVVARAVHTARLHGRGAYLDARSAIGARFSDHFPIIDAAVKSAGLDAATDLLPVAPAAHYHMGGIATDMAGRTSLEGLFALGETGSTGVHGANRLASNSLLEAVVVARNAADAILDMEIPEQTRAESAHRRAAPARFAPKALRALMQEGMGVERTRQGMAGVLEYAEALICHSTLSLHGQIVRAIANAGLARKQSLGAHNLIASTTTQPNLQDNLS
jgi:L-aspartate oxidase